MTAAKKRSITQRLLLSVFAMFAVIIQLLRNMIGILAESAESTSDEATSNAVRGGVLNYRTGKLDDGTDAAGWYEKD